MSLFYAKIDPKGEYKHISVSIPLTTVMKGSIRLSYSTSSHGCMVYRFVDLSQ
jgi:hypothetical protein